MILRIFYDTLVGSVIGNINGILQSIFYKEQSIWKSKLYVSYRNVNLGGFLFIAMAIFIPIPFFYVAEGLFVALPTAFFVTGITLAITSLENFDYLVFYQDRIEWKLLFQTRRIVHVESIILVLRDKMSGASADIIYTDENDLIHSMAEESWKVPVEVIQQLQLKREKLHSNLFEKYSHIKNYLPKQPILSKVRSWKNNTPRKKFALTSVLIFNPFSLTLILSIIFGVFFSNIFLLFLVDISRSYTGFIFRKFISMDYKLDPQLVAKR